MSDDVLFAACALLAAAALHFLAARAGQRLPRWLARRRGGAVGPRIPRAGAVALAVLGAQVAIWVAALWLAGARLMALGDFGERAAGVVARSLRAPLFAMGERAYSALDLLALPLLLFGVWLAVGALVRGVRVLVLAPAGVDAGPQETVAALLRYLATFLGGVIVLQAWGIDLRSVAILASVVGVGIGFGLQNIANNFVSGVLINLGRPIRPGDYVDVGEFAGTVERVGARSTAIRTVDNVSILVPNARFLEREVINWSHGDPLSRVRVGVGVAYGSDVARVRHALLEAARSHAGVLREPRPQVELRRFGESALDFELLVWTRDPQSQQALVSDLNLRIEAALRRARIEIAFARRDLHLHWAAPDPLAAAAAPERASETLATSELRPSEWSEEELAAVARRMRGAGGVEIVDRRHLLSVYPKSFVGREAVDWLVRREGLSRAEAVELGERLVGQGQIHHVLDEHGFRDAPLFYRFRADEP